MLKLTQLTLLLCAFLLSGCVTLEKMPIMQKLAFWKEKKVETVRPESWCYKTLAAVDCYREPQNASPERLVSVDPPAQQPQTRDDHAQALIEAARKRP